MHSAHTIKYLYIMLYDALQFIWVVISILLQLSGWWLAFTATSATCIWMLLFLSELNDVTFLLAWSLDGAVNYNTDRCNTVSSPKAWNASPLNLSTDQLQQQKTYFVDACRQ